MSRALTMLRIASVTISVIVLLRAPAADANSPNPVKCKIAISKILMKLTTAATKCAQRETQGGVPRADCTIGTFGQHTPQNQCTAALNHTGVGGTELCTGNATQAAYVGPDAATNCAAIPPAAWAAFDAIPN